MENLTFTGGQCFCSELQGSGYDGVTSSPSQPTDGEKAWAFRYFELPMLNKLLEMLCESRIMSFIWLFSGIMLCWDSGGKQSGLLKFSALGRSSSRGVLHKSRNKTGWRVKNKKIDPSKDKTSINYALGWLLINAGKKINQAFNLCFKPKPTTTWQSWCGFSIYTLFLQFLSIQTSQGVVGHTMEIECSIVCTQILWHIFIR